MPSFNSDRRSSRKAISTTDVPQSNLAHRSSQAANGNRPAVSPRKQSVKKPIASPLRQEGPAKLQRNVFARRKTSHSSRERVVDDDYSAPPPPPLPARVTPAPAPTSRAFISNESFDSDSASDDGGDSSTSSGILDYDTESSAMSDEDSSMSGSDDGTERQDQDDGSDEESIEEGNKFFRLASNDATLTEIGIECGSIEKHEAKDIAEVLPNNTHIQALCLTCSGEQIGPRRNFEIIVSALAKNSSITNVQIQNAYLNCEAASWLGAALARNKSLQSICLMKCKFVDSGLAILFIGMQHNNQIQELTISSCNLTSSNSDIVAASLPLMKVKSLSLVNANLTLDSLRFLCHNIDKTPSLTQLNLSHNELDRQGIKLVAKSLQKVTKLDLSSCSLDDDCVKELAKGSHWYATLESMNLSGNDFGDRGALRLKDLLERSKSITELKVEGCKISKKVLKAIANGLRYNNSFLKSFFSESTSLAILATVDTIENIGENIGSPNSDHCAARVNP